ncbi:unnamed protein product [Allacma fusca]|uniref:Uncharacterized protein n=1 Tax=Allacma fusca TaxID=39272 RepID=A0A8J2KT61_9HEXA|nr:unnamed protein product [Allacma fusca]
MKELVTSGLLEDNITVEKLSEVEGDETESEKKKMEDEVEKKLKDEIEGKKKKIKILTTFKLNYDLILVYILSPNSLIQIICDNVLISQTKAQVAELTIQALGRNADIVDLYNSATGEFLPINILNNKTLERCVSHHKIDSATCRASVLTSTTDLLKSFNFVEHMQVDILLGIVEASMVGNYISMEDISTDTIAGNAVYRQDMSSESEKRKAEADLSIFNRKLSTVFSGSGSLSGIASNLQSHNTSKVDFDIRGDLLLNSTDKFKSLEDIVSLIQTIPSRMKVQNPQGRNLMFTMYPTTNLLQSKPFNDRSIDVVATEAKSTSTIVKTLSQYDALSYEVNNGIVEMRKFPTFINSHHFQILENISSDVISSKKIFVAKAKYLMFSLRSTNGSSHFNPALYDVANLSDVEILKHKLFTNSFKNVQTTFSLMKTLLNDNIMCLPENTRVESLLIYA